MEMENETPLFYGNLVKAAINKDIKHMIKLIATLDKRQICTLNFALLKIGVVSDTVIKIRKDAN